MKRNPPASRARGGRRPKPSPLPGDSDPDIQHLAGLTRQREQRERWRDAFLAKAARTSRSHRRWFRLDETEPDAAKREELLPLLRAAIYSGDLDHNGKTQVLCLSATPLLPGHRLPSELAKGEHFNMIVGDLWMSAPRWLEWFKKIERPPPAWLVQMCEEIERQRRPTAVSEQADELLASLPDAREPAAELIALPGVEPKTPESAAAWNALKFLYPEGGVPADKKTSFLHGQVNRWIRKQPRNVISVNAVSRETVERVLGRRK